LHANCTASTRRSALRASGVVEQILDDHPGAARYRLVREDPLAHGEADELRLNIDRPTGDTGPLAPSPGCVDRSLATVVVRGGSKGG
jgi:hypothetical protein